MKDDNDVDIAEARDYANALYNPEHKYIRNNDI